MTAWQSYSSEQLVNTHKLPAFLTGQSHNMLIRIEGGGKGRGRKHRMTDIYKDRKGEKNERKKTLFCRCFCLL